MSVNLQPLKDYLLKNIIKGKNNISDDEKLFSTGIIDSFGMLDLLFFIREQYGANIEDYEIADNNVDSLNDLDKLISSKI